VKSSMERIGHDLARPSFMFSLSAGMLPDHLENRA
jgi:hypothetical protein